jgi:hypothetical protein
MNKNTLSASCFLVTFLILIGCQDTYTSKTISTEITASEKEIAQKAITARIDEIIAGANNLDVEAAAQPYSDAPEFKIINSDGSVSDLETMKSVQEEAFKSLASMNFKTIKQDFTFLAKDLVMCTWTGSNEFELKTGEKLKIEPYVGSLLFRNKNDEWKIIYTHETAAPPVLVEQGS